MIVSQVIVRQIQSLNILKHLECFHKDADFFISSTISILQTNFLDIIFQPLSNKFEIFIIK